MSYVKSYFQAVGSTMLVLGFVHLLATSMDNGPLFLYFVFFSLMVGVAGPIRMKMNAPPDKEPELDQSKHPFNILGEETWFKLSPDERHRFYFEWTRPQREYWENKGHKPLFSSFGDVSKTLNGDS